MAQLANELQDMIIDFLHDDQDSLRACSLVCKSWLPASRLHRFRNNSRNKKRQSPISWAAECQLEDLARVLLGREDVHAASWDREWHHPLYYLTRNGNEAITKLLLARPGVSVDMEEGITPLLRAMRCGHAGIARLLLEYGNVDVNVVDDNNRTPLIYAAECQSIEVVKLLLERNGIEVNTTDNTGRTALHWAALRRADSIVELLLQRDDIDVNKSEQCGRTPLALAVANCSVHVVKLLLERNNLDVIALDPYRRTALSYAARTGNSAMVKLLLGRDDIDVNRSHPLHESIGRRSTLKPLKLLLERDDLKVNEIYRRDTPLLKAVYCYSEDAVRLLLARGDIDVNVKDQYQGRTPLLWAAFQGSEGVVRMLLEKEGVDINAVSKRGETAIECAIACRHGEVAKLLLERQRAIESRSQLPPTTA